MPRLKRTNRIRRTDQEKEQIIRQVEQQRTGEPYRSIAAIAESLGMSAPTYQTLKKRYMAAHPRFNPLEPSKELTVRLAPIDPPKANPQHNGRPSKFGTPAQQQAILDEYVGLTGVGVKTAWLNKHHLNHQNIHDLKKRLGVIPKRQAKKQAPRPATVAEFRARANQPPIDLTPEPLYEPPSLADAIMAMEVKRDQLNAFIEDLKRMQGGRR